MRPPPKLTLPGLAALLVLAAVLAYLERREPGAPAEPDVAPATMGHEGAEAGTFDYYSLVLSWSPTHCESPDGADDAGQCARRDERRYAFVLHGLWPQYARGYPEDCPARTRYVPDRVIDAMRDVMPSKGLIIHEYRKHGTCSGLSPEAYYAMARRLYEEIRIPEAFRNPAETQTLAPGDVVQAFVAANPKLEAGMIAVGCGGRGSLLREVRICFSKDGSPRACGANERKQALCRAPRVSVPPVR